MIFGYMRISTNKTIQKIDRQRLTLENYAKENNFTIDKFIEETISGTVKTDNRPKYNTLKCELRPNDTLIVTDLDRLGRNADDVIMELKELKKSGIRVIALDTPYMNDWNKVNDDSMYEMIIDILITLKAHMAQQEREKIVNRINQGLDVAREKGIKLGRKESDIPEVFIREYKKYKSGVYGNMSTTNFAKMMGIARSTFYKYRDEIEGKEITINNEFSDEFIKVYNDYKNKVINAKQGMEILDMKKSLFYKRIKEYEELTNNSK